MKTKLYDGEEIVSEFDCSVDSERHTMSPYTNDVHGRMFLTSARLIFEPNPEDDWSSLFPSDEHNYNDIKKIEGTNKGLIREGILTVRGLNAYDTVAYKIRKAREVASLINRKFLTKEHLEITSSLMEKHIAGLAMAREKHLDYEGAIEIYEENNMPGEAARVRRKMYDEKKVDQTVVHGDYVDDRDTIIKDSVISKSNIGADGDDKFTKLKELTEMKKEGLIDDAEFKQMKKEILGR